MKSFFEALQALDEATKRKVMVVATIVLMIGVVYVWLGYFNGLVAGSSQNGSSTATIANDFAGAVKGIGGAFQNPGQYTVGPSQQTSQ